MADLPVTAVAVDGKVHIGITGGPRWHADDLADLATDLSVEEAGDLANAIMEAQLIAMSGRVRARQARHAYAVDVGLALAESAAAALDRLAPTPALDTLRGRLQEQRAKAECRHCGMSIERLEHGWTDLAGWYACVKAPAGPFGTPVLHEPMPEAARDWVPRHAAPDYQHPEPGDGDDD